MVLLLMVLHAVVAVAVAVVSFAPAEAIESDGRVTVSAVF